MAFDKIRQMVMIKMDLSKRIVDIQYTGHVMLPSVITALHVKARGLKMKCIRRSTYVAEVIYTKSKNREWRCRVDSASRTCSCRKWKIYGQPCIHALFFRTIIVAYFV